MNSQELMKKENTYYVAQVNLKNTEIELSNSLIYLNNSKNSLKNGYLVNETTEDDGNIEKIIEKINNLKTYIKNKSIPHLEREKNKLKTQIEQAIIREQI